MILGKDLKELVRYKGISNNLDEAIDFILHKDLSSYEVGNYQIKDETIKLIREDYEPRAYEKCYFEGHEKFIDIQIVLEGTEGFGYVNINHPALVVTEAYNVLKDVAKYSVDPELIFNMERGSFAIVFPEDLHMPKIRIKDNVKVKKAVFKVKI